MSRSFLTSAPGDDPIISEALFKAAPARVFKAWTDPDEILCWFGQEPYSVKSARIDLRVGGTWRFAFSDAEGAVNALRGEYLEIEKDARLVFTWMHEHSGEDGALETSPVSQVSVIFAPSGSGTHLTIRHENIVRTEARRNVGSGWDASLRSLRNVIGKES